jgi:hypothetical protein
MSSIRTKSFGGNGGDAFPHTLVNEIGLRTGNVVDQIRVSGKVWGRDGGDDRGSITLEKDEYVSKVELRACKALDYINLTTNKGRTFGAGGDGGDYQVLDNIRLISIGGRCDHVVDQISLKYVEDYQPSTLLQENAKFIVNYAAPYQEFEEYTSSRERKLESYEMVTEHMVRQTYSASVEAEYYVKVAASTSIEVQDTSKETIQKSLEQELQSGTKRTQQIPADHVGIKFVTGNLMRAADGKTWMYPTRDVALSVIAISDWQNVLGHYDLTGELYTQMPGLKSSMSNNGDYVYYA